MKHFYEYFWEILKYFVDFERTFEDFLKVKYFIVKNLDGGSSVVNMMAVDRKVCGFLFYLSIYPWTRLV